MSYHPGKLGRDGDEKSLLILRKPAMIPLLHHQYAQKIALMNNRGA